MTWDVDVSADAMWGEILDGGRRSRTSIQFSKRICALPCRNVGHLGDETGTGGRRYLALGPRYLREERERGAARV